jgi:putative molybdopterin biosynthesis protein
MLESGHNVPSAALALRLARALGCRVEDLFWTEEAPPLVDAELAADDQEPAPVDRRRAATGNHCGHAE